MSIEHGNTKPVAVPTTIPAAPNPLSKFFRTPAIYYSLPSGGKFWPPGSVEIPENGELAVYPMTNRDEIMLRTPDALINGNGVVDTIMSCVPQIKDAWKMPSTDVDATLVAMRIASYGHQMDFSSKCPGCDEEHDYAIDLRHMLETIKMPDYNQPLELDVVKIFFRPQKYWENNFANKTSFEVRKLQQAIENLPADEENEERTKALTDQLMKVSDINVRLMTSSTDYIEVVESGERVMDPVFIQDFYTSISRDVFDKIQKEITRLQVEGAIQPQKVSCAGCGGPLEITIMFDYANFFVVGS